MHVASEYSISRYSHMESIGLVFARERFSFENALSSPATDRSRGHRMQLYTHGGGGGDLWKNRVCGGGKGFYEWPGR